jgi:hypothetical protein
LAESGLGLRERTRRPEIGGRIRTLFGTRFSVLDAIAGDECGVKKARELRSAFQGFSGL